MSAPNRILVRGVNWLGDAVMTMPALYRLREAFPDAFIAILTAPKLAALYECQPVIDDTLIVASEEPLRSQSARVRAGRFDTALIFTHSPRSALPFWLAGVPRRVGYGERGRALLLTDPVRAPFAIKIHKRPVGEIRRLAAEQDARAGKRNGTEEETGENGNRFAAVSRTDRVSSPVHHIHHYLHLAAALGANPAPLAPRLAVPDANVQAVRERFGLPTPDASRPLFGLNPGAEYGLAKRWPPEHFIAAAIALQARLNCRWIVTGGASDVELTTRIAQAIQQAADEAACLSRTAPYQAVWNTAGQTSLPELCALLHTCRVVIANDTGPMHTAAAVGASVVVPFGSTTPLYSEPGLPGSGLHRALTSAAACAPCFQRVCPIDFRCMRSIQVSQVMEAVISLHLNAAQD